MSDNNEQVTGESLEEQEQYEGTPEELTNFKPVPGVSFFDRKKVMVILSAALGVIVLGGIIFSSGSSRKKNQAEGGYSFAARAPTDFLQRERDRSLQRPQSVSIPDDIELPEEEMPEEDELLPKAVLVDLREEPLPPAQHVHDTGQYAGSPPPQFVAHFSPLVPNVEGGLFGGASVTPSASSPPPQQTAVDYLSRQPQYPVMQDSYTIQNNQANKTSFYSSSGSTGILSGNFLPEDILWVGTIIPAVLETAINTDLPGNVIARVTQNVYDSQTGQKLLIPQGTILIAKYNSSISYAQSRVQIVWDLLIRPDGYQIELEGMNGVDPKGMAGLKATYHENWFEYVKAAGIITMFSVANAKMAEEAAKYASNDTAAAVVSQNSQFMNQISGTIIGRAMDIQPTLTIKSGEKINIMLNKNMYLPPLDSYPVTEKYFLPK